MRRNASIILTMKYQLLGLILSTLMLSSCGGGGSSASGVPEVVSPSQPTASVARVIETQVISGAATKGPISNATVFFYAIDAFGFPVGDALATTTTDATGNFTVSLPAITAPVLVETLGGSFIDESDQETDVALKRQILLSETQGFLSVLPVGSSTVAITPFTEALVTLVRNQAQVSGDFLGQLAETTKVYSDAIGLDVLTTVPTNPLSPAATATTDATRYALLLGAVANTSNNVAIQLGSATPTYEIIKAVISDLVDGVVDGKQFNSSVLVGDTSRTLPSNIDFEQEMIRFKNNNAAVYTSVALPLINSTSLVNSVPQAIVNVSTSVAQGAQVTLDGTASRDAEASPLTYAWTQLAGTPVTLSSATVAAPTFSAPVIIGALRFRLLVTDPGGLANSAEVVVNVGGVPPTAAAVAVSTKAVGSSGIQNTTVILDGSASTDNLGIVSYQWSQILGAPVTLANANTSIASFTAPPRLIGPAEDLAFSLTVVDADGLTSVAEVQASIKPATNGNKVFVLRQNFAPWMEGSGIESIGVFDFNIGTNTGTLIPSLYTKENQNLAFNFKQDGPTLTIDFEGGGLVTDVISSRNAAIDELTTTTRVNQAVLTLIEDGSSLDLASSQSIGSLTTFNETQGVEVSTVTFDEKGSVSIYELDGRVPLEVAGKTRSLLTNVSTQIATLPDGGGMPALQLDGLTFNQDGTGFAAEKSQSLRWTTEPDGYIRVVFSDGEVGEYYRVAAGASGDVVVAEYTDVNGIAVAIAELSFAQDPTLIVNSSTVAGIYTSQYDLSSADFPEIYNYTTRLAPDGTGEVQYVTVDQSGAVISLTNSVGICWSLNNSGELLVDAVLPTQVVSGSNRPATEFCGSRSPKDGDIRLEKIIYTSRQSVTRESEYFCFGELCGYQVNRFYASVTEPAESFIGDPPRAASGIIRTPVGVPIDVAITSLAQDADGSLDLRSVEIVVPASEPGTLSINASNGVITYAPTTANDYADIFAYQVRDAAGNLSNAANIEVIIGNPISTPIGEPPAVVEPPAIVEPPVILVPTDITANQGSLVTLDGSASTDNLGIVSYQWAQISGTPVELIDANTSIASFTAPPRLIGPAEDLAFSLTVVNADGLTSVAEVQASIKPATNGNKVFVLRQNFAPWMEGSGIESIGVFDFNIGTNTGTLIPSLYTKENQNLAFNFKQDGPTLTIDFEGGGLVTDVISSRNAAIDELTTTTRVNQAVLTLIEDGSSLDLASSQSIGSLTTFNETQGVEVSTVTFDEKGSVSIYELDGRVPLEVAGKTRSLLTNVSTQIATLPDGGGMPALQLDGLTFNQDGTGFAAEKSQSLRWTTEPDGYIRVVFSDGEVGEYYRVAAGASGDVVVAEYTDVNGIAVAIAELSFAQDPTLIVNSSTVAGIYTSQYDLSSADFPEIYNYTTRLAPDGTGEVQYVTVDQSGAVISLTNSVGICWSLNNSGELLVDAVLPTQVVSGSNRPATEFCGSRSPKDGDIRLEKIIYTSRQSVTRESEYFCFGELCGYQVNRFYASVTEPAESFIGDPPRAASSTLRSSVGVPIDVAITSLAQDADGSLDLTSVEIVVPASAPGSLSINASSGIITYTPTGDFAYADAFAYQVRDATGNLSNAANIEVIIVVLDVTVTSSSLTPLSGELVTLSALATDSDVTYAWTQTGGTAVTLSGATTSSPTFTVSGVALFPGGSVDERTFSVTVENADGETVAREVVVTVEAALPLAFFGVEESTIPFKFGVDVNANRSFFVEMPASAAAGVYRNGFGEFNFDVSNLGGAGIFEFTGLDGAKMQSYEEDGYDENSDGFDETIVFTDYAAELAFSLVTDGEGKDIVSVLESGITKAFNSTLNQPSTIADVTYTSTREFTVYDFNKTITFAINDDVRSLQTNIMTKVSSLRANQLYVDTLTFDSTDGTGSARNLDETFVWSIDTDGHLVVDFANGDEADYFHLATRDTGDVVAVVYTEALGSPIRSNVNLSFTQTAPTWTNDIANHAGLYVDIDSIVDSAGATTVFQNHLRINPDGTGAEEKITLFADGSKFWSTRELAICARINVSTGEMIWSYAHAKAQGGSIDSQSSLPLAGYCQSLAESEIAFQQEYTLFDDTSDQYSMTVRETSNTCGYFPVISPMDCDPPGALLPTNFYPRVMQYTAFANFPPVAIEDTAVLVTSSVVVDVLANDLDGGNSSLGANEPSGSVDLIDSGTVEIVIPPAFGTAVVDSSGSVTYTDGGVVAESVEFYYRVKNVSGDSSNVGKVTISFAQ